MRKADHGLKPVYDLPVHQCGGVTAAAFSKLGSRSSRLEDVSSYPVSRATAPARYTGEVRPYEAG